MSLPLSSPAGQRFFASLREGRGLRQSVRDAGVHQEVGYRWLKARYLQLRRTGSSPAEAVAQLGFRSSRMDAWEAELARTKAALDLVGKAHALLETIYEGAEPPKRSRR